MGKSQSKLTTEELKELQRTTNCKSRRLFFFVIALVRCWLISNERAFFLHSFLRSFRAVDKKELQQW